MKGLLVTYFYPPLNVIASHRVNSFARYLNHDNNILDVICPCWQGDLDLGLNKAKIFCTPAQKFDHNFGEIKLTGLSKLKQFVLNKIFRLNHFRSRKPGGFYRDALSLMDTIDLNGYDYIITSYAPLDVIHIGAYIKSKYPKIKWIIDYRDLYSEMEYISYGIFKSNFNRYERKITSKADGFVTVSAVLKQQQQKLIGKKGEIIYNGYEDYKIKEDVELSNELTSLGLPLISHAGSLYKGERDVKPFLAQFARSGNDLKYICVFAVMNDFDEEYLLDVIKETGVKNVLIKRNLSFNQSLILQQHSDFLLLLSNIDGKANGYLTGKLFEYVASGKPIVYSGSVSRGFELYELIKEYNLGESHDRIDYAMPGKYRQKDCSVFHRSKQAARLEEFIHQIVSP